MAKLDELVGFLEANPNQHDQSNWAKKNSCGTAMCAAGWTVELWSSGIDWNSSSTLIDGSMIADSTNAKSSIDIEASNILELNNDEAWHLFECSFDLEGVKHTVKRIANGDFQ